MLNSYLPVLVFLVLGLVVGTLFTIGNIYVGPKKPKSWTPTKQAQEDPYECGLPSEVQDGFRFGISFYLIAMLFILFDVEVLFLYPVAVQLEAFGTFALIETLTFSVLLLIGFVYSWRRGALDWKL
jgi:NADH-quinone oxidoreductase subunit A